VTTCVPDRIQHIGAKVLAATFPPDWLALAIPVFHRWIQQEACEELLIDVADYAHLPVGPGVILVAHEANYGLDRTHGRPGLVYQRKTVLEGSFETRLLYSVRQAFRAARRLMAEPEYQGKLSFDFAAWEIVFNDRLLAPNTEQAWSIISQELDRILKSRLTPDSATWRLERLGEPRDLLRVAVHLECPAGAEQIVEDLIASSAPRAHAAD
jgi:hypothetical protein